VDVDVPFECGNCGALIDLTLQIEDGALAEPRELAVTCDCGKTQWMTLTPIATDMGGQHE
jgi:hypothetical protein